MIKFTKEELMMLDAAIDNSVKDQGRVILESGGVFEVVGAAVETINKLQDLQTKLDDYGEENIKDWLKDLQ